LRSLLRLLRLDSKSKWISYLPCFVPKTITYHAFLYPSHQYHSIIFFLAQKSNNFKQNMIILRITSDCSVTTLPFSLLDPPYKSLDYYRKIHMSIPNNFRKCKYEFFGKKKLEMFYSLNIRWGELILNWEINV
jgi:hypothetical protein